MEDQLLTELFLTFPGGDLSLTCVGCGEECGSDYVKKEHILLSHPWPSLKAEVDETLSKCERTERFDSVDLNDDETEEIRGV